MSPEDVARELSELLEDAEEMRLAFRAKEKNPDGYEADRLSFVFKSSYMEGEISRLIDLISRLST